MTIIAYYDELDLPTTSALTQLEGIELTPTTLRIMQLEHALQSALNMLSTAQDCLKGQTLDVLRPKAASAHIAKSQSLLIATLKG